MTDLNNVSEEQLLNSRICDLKLKIKGTWLEECVSKLYEELGSAGIKFRPEFYLADEWLTPDGEPVIGIPFFLADQVLMKLENKMMMDVEGGTPVSCMKLLRHETGHAINYAYRFYKRRKWKKIFGAFSEEYEDTYRFRPYSRNFVRHIENYYAQYHPDEDFAETFAVWLTPNSGWRNVYKGWKAINKLTYVDKIMNEVKDKEPIQKKGRRYWDASKIKKKLKNYYTQKKHYHAEDFPDFHDANLKKIFRERLENEKKPVWAAPIIRRHRKDMIRNVSMWTGERKYIIDEIVKNLISRCRKLGLVVRDSEKAAILRISVYITSLTMNYVYTGSLRGEK